MSEMVHTETVPFMYWSSWWNANPHLISLASGAIAGMSAEAVLFPLDCFKTRVQSKSGFRGSGGFHGAYRGVGTAIAGSAPASAIFFMTYEFSKHSLSELDDTISGHRRPTGFLHWVIVCIASILGELVACTVRVPVDLAKQRLQAGHANTFIGAVRGVRDTPKSILFASFRTTAMRDISHSSLQYPMYEFLKIFVARQSGDGVENLPSWKAAMCGSVAGALSAMVTTPLDLLKTRLNLRSPVGQLERSAGALVTEEIQQIYAAQGALGFFRGATFRATWMGIGGFIFLGSFEFAKNLLAGKTQRPFKVPRPTSQPRQPLGQEAPAAVSFAAGLVAGVCVDVPLHPVDTIKTRLQAPEGLLANGGFRGLWSGLSAVLLTSVPGSAIFFAVYQRTRHFLDRQTVFIAGAGHEIWRDAAAASLADVSACVVRVPCEVMKQRMQRIKARAAAPSLIDTVRSVNTEGIRGFFAGFGATVSREVPFALIQMPLFEELKRRHPWGAYAEGDTRLHGMIGMTSGCLAGAVSGALTTPFDATKTRIMLTEQRSERLGLFSTMRVIHAEAGVRGLFSGLVPRTVHCSIGGALWLGAFEFSNILFQKCSIG